MLSTAITTCIGHRCPMSLVKPITRFNQRTKRWDIASPKGDKDYSYIPMLMAKIFKLGANDDGSMQDYMEMSLSDPRRIAPTIANVAPLPTSELVAAHRSRFQLMQSQNASSS